MSYEMDYCKANNRKYKNQIPIGMQLMKKLLFIMFCYHFKVSAINADIMPVIAAAKITD